MAIMYLNTCVKEYRYADSPVVRAGVKTLGEYDDLLIAVDHLRKQRADDPEGIYYLSKIPSKKWKKNGAMNDLPIPSEWRDDKEAFAFKTSQRHLLRLPLAELERTLKVHMARAERVRKAIETKKNGTKSK